MKQNISPKVLIPVIVGVLLILGVALARVMQAPSVVPPAGANAKPVNPYGGAAPGPTEEDLKRMREYNAAHPGASSSRR